MLPRKKVPFGLVGRYHGRALGVLMDLVKDDENHRWVLDMEHE